MLVVVGSKAVVVVVSACAFVNVIADRLKDAIVVMFVFAVDVMLAVLVE